MQARATAAAGRDTSRQSIASITGETNAVDTLGELRRAKMQEKRGTLLVPSRVARRNTRMEVARVRAASPKTSARTAAEAADLLQLSVSSHKYLVLHERFWPTLERRDDAAYENALRKDFRLDLTVTPREDHGKRMRAEFRGLGRIARGWRVRRNELKSQLEQTAELLSVASGDFRTLVLKRSRLAKARLELMDELTGQEVMNCDSGKAAMRLLLEQLAKNGDAQLCGTRTELEEHSKQHSLSNEEMLAIAPSLPIKEHAPEASSHLALWRALEDFLGKHKKRKHRHNKVDGDKLADFALLLEKKHAIVQAETLTRLRETSDVTAEEALAGVFGDLHASCDRFRPLLERSKLADEFLEHLRARREQGPERRPTTGRRATTIIQQREAGEDGQLRRIANEDEFMDSDALHGVQSRVRITVLEPLLRSRLEAGTTLRQKLRGELSILTQFALTLAVPHAQRTARGYLSRLQHPLALLRDLQTRRALFAACVEIQRLWRRSLASAWRRMLGELHVLHALTRIQAAIRAYLARARCQTLSRERFERLTQRSATLIQVVYRGRRGRLIARAKQKFLLLTTETAKTNWAATAINAASRRHLALRLQRRRRVESDCNQKLLALAHRYLSSGDIWAFLKAVDEDYGRAATEMADLKKLELEDAQTFVNEVLKQRDGDNTAAWQGFLKAAGEHHSESTLNLPKIRLILEGLSSKEQNEKEKGKSLSPLSTTKVIKKTRRKKNAALPEEEELPTQLMLPDVTSKPAGLTVLVDLPLGLEDTIERFLCAAGLRCYIGSSFPRGTTAEQALAQYLALPPSLVKCRHEMEARATVNPWIAALRGAGYRTVRQLLPPRRLRATLQSLEKYVKEAPITSRMFVVQIPAVEVDSLYLASKVVLEELFRVARRSGEAPYVSKEKHRRRFEDELDKGRVDVESYDRLASLPELAHVAAKHPLANPMISLVDDDDFSLARSSVCTEEFYARQRQEAERGERGERGVRGERGKLGERGERDERDERGAAGCDESLVVAEEQSMLPDDRVLKLAEQFEASVFEEIRSQGGLECSSRFLIEKTAFLADNLLEFCGELLRVNEEDDVARFLVMGRTRSAALLAKPMVKLAAENHLRTARDLAAIDFEAFGDLGEHVRVILRGLSNGNSFLAHQDAGYRTSTVVGRAPEDFLHAHVQPSGHTRRIPFDARFMRSPTDPTGHPARLPGAGRKLRPDENLARAKTPASLSYEAVLAERPPRLYAPNTEEHAEVKIKTKKKMIESVTLAELLPLHAQPLALVGGGRSRKVHERIHQRATGRFPEYQRYSQTAQLTRDPLDPPEPETRYATLPLAGQFRQEEQDFEVMEALEDATPERALARALHQRDQQIAAMQRDQDAERTQAATDLAALRGQLRSAKAAARNRAATDRLSTPKNNDDNARSSSASASPSRGSRRRRKIETPIPQDDEAPPTTTMLLLEAKPPSEQPQQEAVRKAVVFLPHDDAPSSDLDRRRRHAHPTTTTMTPVSAPAPNFDYEAAFERTLATGDYYDAR